MYSHGTVEVLLNPSYPITLGGWLRSWAIRGYRLRGANFGVNLVFVAAREYGLGGCMSYETRRPG